MSSQSDDTKLRDLVTEALEKNGSLAKVRALLRANVFLAFEDNGKVKHNMTLDKILDTDGGLLALSIVHEFLEFCNLKNTLFVYTAETRQGKDYKYGGKRNLYNKLAATINTNEQEPVLLTLLKSMKLPPSKLYGQGDDPTMTKEEQNYTYIVHDNSGQSTSQSEQSSDERKTQHLDSDTDTSSDSNKDKSKSEYIANENIIMNDETDDNKSNSSQQSNESKSVSDSKSDKSGRHEKSDPGFPSRSFPFQLKDITDLQCEESSYNDIQPYGNYIEKSSDHPIIPNATNHNMENLNSNINKTSNSNKLDLNTSPTLSYVNSISSALDATFSKLSQQESNKLDTISKTADYTYDFTSSYSPNSHQLQQKHKSSIESPKEGDVNQAISPQQHSQSSQSSVSISDVADLLELSEALSPSPQNQPKDVLQTHKPNLSHTESPRHDRSNKNDDSGEFSDTPVPSLSNLSLDFHSD